MEKSDVVIIGGVACGCKTAASLARRLPNAKITVFQKEPDLSYGTCGLPYFASGDIENLNKLRETASGSIRDAEYFRKTKGFGALTECEVVEINRTEKYVTVKNLQSGENFQHGYDKLVIATGAVPVRPPIEIPESDRIKPFTRPADAVNFRKLAQTGQVGSAIIVGGGFIGCELTETCAGLWGLETTLIEREPQVLPYVLDPEMADMVELAMRENNIAVHTGTSVTKIEASDETVKVTLSDNTEIEADYLFMCVGVRPASELVKSAGLELGTRGAVKVNEFMQTSDPDIYAGGDVVELKHQLTEQPIYIPMGSLANRHGRIIADHIAGGSESFPGVLGAFMVKVFEINAGSVGLSEASAAKAGFETEVVWGSFVDKPDYYPEFQPFSVKMVINKSDRSLLGLQAVGRGDVVRRIDVFSAFLLNKAQIDDLLDFEHGYAPPYSEALDPLYHLAAVYKTIENGFLQSNPGIDYGEIDVTILDVRDPSEIETKPFKAKKLINIPLEELQENLNKVDKSQPIIVLCHRGPRSYQALHILKKAGFDHLSYVAGGTSLALKALA